jgi:hypothetical protein
MIEANVNLISNFTFIESFSKAYKEKILKYTKPFEKRKDQYIFRENEEPDSIYMLLEGSVVLQKEFWVSYWSITLRLNSWDLISLHWV